MVKAEVKKVVLPDGVLKHGMLRSAADQVRNDFSPQCGSLAIRWPRN